MTSNRSSPLAHPPNPRPTAEVADQAKANWPDNAGSTPILKVYLLDDHPVVATGIRIAFSANQHLRLVGFSASLEHGFTEAVLANADALVLDLAFSGQVRTDAVRTARNLLPQAIIVIFSALPANSYASEARQNGADAYVSKEFDIAHLASIIVGVSAQRGAAFSQVMAPSPSTKESCLVDGVYLTRREAQVASLLGRGLDVADIAIELAVSRRTIAVHRDSVRRKLGCVNSRALIAKLVRIDAASV